jgi:2-methylcitrate dehydratase PrpD
MSENVANENLTLRLVDQVREISIGDLDEKVIEKTKLALLDAIGCASYGSNTTWSKAVVDYVRDLSSKPQSTVILNNLKADPSNAALANGTMIHSYELDDVFMEGKMHPGAAVIPAVFSLAESTNADGKSLIESIVWGYEAMGRIGLGLGANAAKSRGWHITGVCGTFGAAAAASRLLDLSREEMASAFGLAGTQSSGLFAFLADGSMTKRIHPGRAAQSGVMSAILSKKGFKGPTKVLEAEDGGFLKAFSDGYNLGRVLRRPEDKKIIERTGFKFYSCCGSIHPALDATKKLIDESGAREDQIEGIDVGVSGIVETQCGWEYQPLSTLQAQMSLKYCVATMVRDGEVFVEQFMDNKIRDPQTIGLSKRVNVYVDKQSESAYPKKNPAKVTLRLKNGTASTLYLDEPKGLSEEYTVTRDDIVSKFLSITKSAFGSRSSSEIVKTVLDLDKMSSLERLFEMLR